MFQFLPFILGLATGSATVRVARSKQARQGLDRARAGIKALEHPGSSLRSAALSSLEALEQGSARLRAKMDTAPAAEAPVEPSAPAAPAAATRKARTPRRASPAPAAAAAEKPARAPRRKKAASPATESTTKPQAES